MKKKINNIATKSVTLKRSLEEATINFVLFTFLI